MVLPICVVTGAAAGIGAAIAATVAERGHHVIVSDLDLGAAEETAARIEAAGHRATAIKLDMSDREAIVNSLVNERLSLQARRYLRDLRRAANVDLRV